jgi:hypothetical protein
MSSFRSDPGENWLFLCQTPLHPTVGVVRTQLDSRANGLLSCIIKCGAFSDELPGEQHERSGHLSLVC